MDIDRQLLDGLVAEAVLPMRHHPRARTGDRLDDVVAAAAVEPDSIGQARRPHFTAALAVGAVARGTVVGEDPGTFRPGVVGRSGRGALAGEADDVVGDLAYLLPVENADGAERRTLVEPRLGMGGADSVPARLLDLRRRAAPQPVVVDERRKAGLSLRPRPRAFGSGERR